MRVILLLLALLIAPAPPSSFTARWDTATSATIQWTQESRACLYREPRGGATVFLGCFDRPGATITLRLGHTGPVDASYRPQAGDVYVLQKGGVVSRAPLWGRAVYLPVIR